MAEKMSANLTMLDNAESETSEQDDAANDPAIPEGGEGASEHSSSTPAPEICVEDDDSPLPAPSMIDEMYYGLTGDVMHEASDGTEVHPAAAGMAFISMVAIALGRGRFLRIGNDVHHPRIFSIHVGPTGAGGKGMALGLVKAIRLVCEQDVDPRFPICGHYHEGGLSSREGLAWAMRDPSDEKDKDGNSIDAGIDDKRLFVIEEEFANVLAQSKRDGNTLSSALRTLWDGGDLAPLTKTNRTRATRPHVGIHACITRTELVKSLATRDLTNGFANRFLYVWGQRQGIVAFPRSSPERTVDDFAKRLKQAIKFSQFGGAVEVSEDARHEFALFYHGHRKGFGLSEQVHCLTERFPPYAWRLAMVFALLDCSDTITGAHMRAALAWLKFCSNSVGRVFSNVLQHADAADAGSLVPRIMEALRVAGGQLDHVALHAAVGKPQARILKLALSQAEMAGVVDVKITRREAGGRPRRTYSLKA